MITGGKAILAVIALGALATGCLPFSRGRLRPAGDSTGPTQKRLQDCRMVTSSLCWALSSSPPPRAFCSGRDGLWHSYQRSRLRRGSSYLLPATVATSWHAVGTDDQGAFIYAGNPTAVPYVIAGIAIVIMVIASLRRHAGERTR